MWLDRDYFQTYKVAMLKFLHDGLIQELFWLPYCCPKSQWLKIIPTLIYPVILRSEIQAVLSQAILLLYRKIMRITRWYSVGGQPDLEGWRLPHSHVLCLGGDCSSFLFSCGLRASPYDLNSKVTGLLSCKLRAPKNKSGSQPYD